MITCRITVLKRTFNKELIDEYVQEERRKTIGPCKVFHEGQEFITDIISGMPEGCNHRLLHRWNQTSHFQNRKDDGPGLRGRGCLQMAGEHGNCSVLPGIIVTAFSNSILFS